MSVITDSTSCFERLGGQNNFCNCIKIYSCTVLTDMADATDMYSKNILEKSLLGGETVILKAQSSELLFGKGS